MCGTNSNPYLLQCSKRTMFQPMALGSFRVRLPWQPTVPVPHSAQHVSTDCRSRLRPEPPSQWSRLQPQKPQHFPHASQTPPARSLTAALISAVLSRCFSFLSGLLFCRSLGSLVDLDN